MIQDPAEWEKFTAQLFAPVPGASKKISDASAEAEGQAFMTTMKMLNGGA